jgi:hypothetical protein
VLLKPEKKIAEEPEQGRKFLRLNVKFRESVAIWS